MSEHAKTFDGSEEPQAKAPEEEPGKLTQRELVRLSLLCCPPAPAEDPPRR